MVTLWPKTYFVPIFAVGFTHYVLGFFYGFSKFKNSLTTQTGRWCQLFLFAIAAIAFAFNNLTSAIIFFGLHLGLTEGYDTFQSKREPSFHGLRFLFYFLCYIIASYRDFPFIPAGDIFVALIPLSLLACALMTVKEVKSTLKESIPGDLLFFVICMWIYFGDYSAQFRIPFIIGLYHFLFWTVGPLIHKGKEARAQLITNLGLNALMITGLMFFLSGRPDRFGLVFSQYLFWSYLHFSTSLSTSKANPEWINSLFRSSAS